VVVTELGPPKKKRSKQKSPTARSLEECRRRGWIAQSVERPPTRYNPRRIDLFGVIDLVAITPDGILGIQATSGSNHSSRVNKALQEPRLVKWLGAGARFEVWSWQKRGRYWELRDEEAIIKARD
jgi:hypothetical protein